MASSDLMFPEAAWVNPSLLDWSGRTNIQAGSTAGSQSNDRRVFTICSENDEVNPPQGLSSKLADLEASAGLVTLSSDSNASSVFQSPRYSRRIKNKMEPHRSATLQPSPNYISVPQDVPYAVHSSQLMSWISGQKRQVIAPEVNSNEHPATTSEEVQTNSQTDIHNTEKTIEVETEQIEAEKTSTQYFPQSTTVIFGQRLAESEKYQGQTKRKIISAGDLDDTSTQAWSVVSNDGSTATEDENVISPKNSCSSESTVVLADQDRISLSSSTTVPEEDTSASTAPTLKVEYVSKIWDAYINDFLLGCDHIQEAAIYDKATKSCIACSLGFTMRDREFNQLLESLSCLQLAYKVGVTVGGRHFKTALADGRRGLMAKGKDQTGCSACQTRTLVIIALHDHTGKGRRCNEELMRLGDFFWAKGL